ncbi:MAG: Baseplate J-like protein [Myxococcaceae bacterium]|nr:Baseplate J-like protein [Myxococcaceae bacterium]
MTVSSVTEILVAKTEDQLLAEQLGLMAAADPPFPVTAWAPGDVALTLVETDCAALADVHQTVGLLGASAFLGTATGDWLTLRAKSTFDLSRILATYTTGTVTLACSALAGPHTIGPGALVITTAAGYRFRSTNTGNVVVPQGGTVAVGVQAEAAGAAYNRTGGELTIVVTPALAGLSVTAASGAGWITRTARDEETDAALVTRCRARWATLATAGCGTRDAYTFNLLGALRPDGSSAGVTRAGFLSPPGNGEVPIRIAGATGPLSDADRNYVRTWIAARKPITDTPLIEHAGTVAVDLSSSTVTFKAGLNTSGNREAVRAAVRDFINAQPMGSDLEVVLIDEAAIAATIYRAAPAGSIADVDLGTGDVTVTNGYVATVDTSTLNFA